MSNDAGMGEEVRRGGQHLEWLQPQIPLSVDDALAAAVEVVREARTSPEGRALVAVDGLSGSGKTTLAAAIQRSAQPAPEILRLDDVYPNWHGLAAGLENAQRMLAAWAEGHDVRFTPTRWPGMDERALVTLRAADSLIVEGVGASSVLPHVTPPTAIYACWLHVPTDVRRARALTRDGDTFAPHWSSWADQEQVWFTAHPPPPHTHLVSSYPPKEASHG